MTQSHHPHLSDTVDADRSIEDLMREALGDLFAKHE
jgi:hypothetical protein